MKVGRNDPCPCGSGKKYKKCCGRLLNGKITSTVHDEILQKEVRLEKERMISLLKFDESLRGKVEELFDISFEGIPAGMEPAYLSTAIFKIEDRLMAAKKIEELEDVDFTGEDDEGRHYTWTRAYPKGHWNPFSSMPGARQIIGDIHITFDNTLLLETKTKGWMTGLIYHMMAVLGRGVSLIDLKFKDPLDFVRSK